MNALQVVHVHKIKLTNIKMIKIVLNLALVFKNSLDKIIFVALNVNKMKLNMLGIMIN